MLTVLAVFNSRTDPESVIRRLAASGIEAGRIGLIWRERNVRAVEEMEVVTYVDHFDSPMEEARKGAVGGMIGGAGTVAAGAALASAGLVLNPELVTLGLLPLTTAAAAAGGGITGGAIGALLGATDHDATQVRRFEAKGVESVERIGFVLSVEVEADPKPVAGHLKGEGANEVTVLDSDGQAIRVHLDDSSEANSPD